MIMIVDKAIDEDRIGSGAGNRSEVCRWVSRRRVCPDSYLPNGGKSMATA